MSDLVVAQLVGGAVGLAIAFVMGWVLKVVAEGRRARKGDDHDSLR